jgi:CheY-like chemotaxis protein
MSDDPTEALPPRGRSLRILVVEDHGDTLRVLARLLDHFGDEISLANGAQSALEIVESKEFDVVLSCAARLLGELVVMPETEIIQACERFNLSLENRRHQSAHLGC